MHDASPNLSFVNVQSRVIRIEAFKLVNVVDNDWTATALIGSRH